MDEKAKRLADIMFEEDEYRDTNDMELMYHTKEDFEAEKRERKEKNVYTWNFSRMVYSLFRSNNLLQRF